MDSFGVVGLTWRQGGPRALARFTLPVEERGRHVRALAEAIGVRELVYLATCNRVEIAFVADDDIPVSELRRRIHAALVGADSDTGEAARDLRAWQGEGAAEHLFLVACGLDSARLGETEILGQVRDALDLARSLDLVHERLSLLFAEALKLAKRTRHETGLGAGRTSLAEIGLDKVRERTAHSKDPVALIGVSAMTERCARSLVEEGREVLIVNRSLGRAETLASSLGARARASTLADFLSSPPPLAALLSATGAPGAILGPAELEHLTRARDPHDPLVCIDFATSPDVDPAAASEFHCERFGMDEILAIAERNRGEKLRESGEARDLVDRALARIAGRLARSRAEQAIGALHDTYVETARRQVDMLLGKHFTDLDEERSSLLRRFAERLARHYAHVPSTGLRELAERHGPQLVEDFFAHGDHSLQERLTDALDASQLYGQLLPVDEDPQATLARESGPTLSRQKRDLR